jgi:hypothetical protein
MRFSCRVVLLLLLVTLAAVAPRAEAADWGILDFDVRGGVTLSGDWDPGYAFGGSLGIAELSPGFYLYAAAMYMQAEESLEGQFGDFDVEISSLAFGAEVRYFTAGEPRGWYFGGGPYLHLLDEEVAISLPPFGELARISVESEELGATGVAGYKLGAGSGFFVEGRAVVVSGWNSGLVLVGFSF